MQATFDHWRRATSQSHFEKLVKEGEKYVGQASSYKTLWIKSYRIFKQLPNSPVTWLFLTCLGTFAAIYSLLVDAWVWRLRLWRSKLIHLAPPDSIPGFFIWFLWSTGICLLATSFGHFLSPAADGSGVPRMRALFAGVYQDPKEALSAKILIAKSISTILSCAAGLSIGRAGPYTHICACFAYLLRQFSVFRKIQHRTESFTYLRAALASGITANFASPLGGLLFSIEITAKYYEIKCLWEGMICSSICVLVFDVLAFFGREIFFERTKFQLFALNWEIAHYVVVGILTGFAGGIFCKCALLLRYIQTRAFEWLKVPPGTFQKRVAHILPMCFISAFLAYPFRIMRVPDRDFVNELFRDEPLTGNHWMRHESLSPLLVLMFYIPLKFFDSILPCGSPLSVGVFGPLFTIGAAIGRLYGETVGKYTSASESPATYAVVGAVSLAASTTQTVSTTIIFFELTGQMSHMLPVMLSSLVAYFIRGSLAPSIYDILAGWAGLHSVCYDIKEAVYGQAHANNNMVPVNVVFTTSTTYVEALQALSDFSSEEYFPICNDLDSRLLIGAIRRYDLEIGCARYISMHKNLLPEDVHPEIATRIKTLISNTLRPDAIKRHTVADVLPLMKFQSSHVDDSHINNPLQLGPPFDDLVFHSIPVESYPPQVGENVNLSRVHKLAALAMWTQVYVVNKGKLLGVINLEKSLTKLRKEENEILSGLE